MTTRPPTREGRAPRRTAERRSEKSMRHFYVVDALWRGFEELADTYDCSVDYLLNEAMRLYLRSKQQPAAPPRTPSPLSATGPRPPVPVRPEPPPQPPRPHPVPPPRVAEPAPRVLVLTFNEQEIAITKDAFVIGRKQAGTDLVIKDGNISRHHAAILRRDGVHYLKDLGSTNGVSFQGQRVEVKRIEEGDLFRICDYELRFSYRAVRSARV